MEERDLIDLIDLLSQEGPNWTAEENEVSKLSDADKKRRLGYLPEEEEGSLADREERGKAAFEAYTAAEDTYPSLFNWQSAGKTSPVMDQGNCGSCVAFGSSTSLATLGIIEGLLPWSMGTFNNITTLSAAYLFYCVAAKQGRNCANGWFVSEGVSACADKGVPYYPYYPYTSGNQSCGVIKPWDGIVAGSTGSYTDIDQMRSHIANVGPLVTGFTVYSDFYKYKKGIYAPGPKATPDGGHCVSVVGYFEGGKLGPIPIPAYWVCQNSWGTKWGIDGFFYIQAGVCGIDTQMYYMKDPSAVTNES